MPSNKKRFNKKGAYRFAVVHRSQLDPEYEKEGVSKYVLQQIGGPPIAVDFDGVDVAGEEGKDRGSANSLVGSGLKLNANSLFKVDGEMDLDANQIFDMAEDQVDLMGFPKDGYNYSKHLKEIGDGTFIGRDGTIRSATTVVGTKGAASTMAAAAATASNGDASSSSSSSSSLSLPSSSSSEGFTLPKDVLPGTGREKNRQEMAKSVAVSTRRMDRDVAAALDGLWDVAEDGDFDTTDFTQYEEMDDNFIAQATAVDDEDGADAADGFDFDAHIARLMGMARKEEEGADADDDDDEYDDLDDDDFGADGEGKGDSGLGVSAVGGEARRDLDDCFEALLAREYNVDEEGDLEEQAEEGTEEITGTYELTGGELGAVLKAYDDERAEATMDVADHYAALSRMALKEVEEVQQRSAQSEVEAKAGGGAGVELEEEDPEDGIEETIPYSLTKQREKWDCESIVSTYSTTDNHPAVLRLPTTGARARAKARRRERLRQERMAAERGERILLSSKTGMPLEFSSSSSISSSSSSSSSSPSTASLSSLPSASPASASSAVVDLTRRKGETAEEKRKRKAAVKAARRAARQRKKQTKDLFKTEKKSEKEKSHRGGNKDVGENITVFKY